MTTHLKHSYGREPVGGLRAENREYVVSIVPVDPVKSRAQHTFELVRIFGGCEHGLRIYRKHKMIFSPDPNGVMHDSRGSALTQFYRRRARSWDSEKRGKPTVHESVAIRTSSRNKAEAPPYHPWILKMEHEVEPWPEPLRTAGHFT